MVIDLGMGKGARTHVLHTTHHLPQSNTTAAPPPAPPKAARHADAITLSLPRDPRPFGCRVCTLLSSVVGGRGVRT